MWPRSWRKRAGLIILGVSFLPWLLLPVLPFLDWSLEAKALAATGVVVAAEGLAVIAVALLGPEVVQQLKRIAKAAVKELRKSKKGEEADSSANDHQDRH